MNDDDNKSMPAYDGKAKAAEALGHPIFYYGDAEKAKKFASVRQLVCGDMTVDEVGFYLNSPSRPSLRDGDKASEFFSKTYFYSGSYAMANLYKPIRESKFGAKTVGEVMRLLVTDEDFFDCFLVVGVPRAAVAGYRHVPPADDFRFVPACNGDEKAKDFFSHPIFYFGNEHAADVYAFVREEDFGDKSVYELTGPCRSYSELEKIFKRVGINRGIQIIQYHPAYAYVFASPFFRWSKTESEES
jgi:hypothetical protein